MRKFIFLACIALLSVTSASALTSISPPQKVETYIVQPSYEFIELIQDNTVVSFAESINVTNNVSDFTFESIRPIKRFGFIRPTVYYGNSSGNTFNYNFKKLHSTEIASKYLLSKPCIRFLSFSFHD